MSNDTDTNSNNLVIIRIAEIRSRMTRREWKEFMKGIELFKGIYADTEILNEIVKEYKRTPQDFLPSHSLRIVLVGLLLIGLDFGLWFFG